MQIVLNPVNAAHQPLTEISKAVRVQVGVLIWLARRWQPQQVLQGTLLMFVVCKGVGAMKKTTLLLGLIFFVLTGCNTIHGIGKDFEKLGDKIQDASKK